jgi:hypothetical protein
MQTTLIEGSQNQLEVFFFGNCEPSYVSQSCKIATTCFLPFGKQSEIPEVDGMIAGRRQRLMS